MKKAMYRLTLAVTAASLCLISVNLFASETDDRIESSAKKSYVFKTYLSGDDIKIKSEDGVVTLTGTVSEESYKSLAFETVAGMPGVKSVDNKLEVKGEVPVIHTDAWLITRVKSALLFHRSVNAAKTAVFVEDGTVTLRGEATSKAQKDLTAEYAKDIEGVKDVKNEMTVLTPEMKQEKMMGEKTVGEKVSDMGEWIDDSSITALVKTTLMYHRSTSGLSTAVDTKEGVVTLNGEVGNEAEKELAAKFASDVNGVKSVINKMTIKGTEPKTNN